MAPVQLPSHPAGSGRIGRVLASAFFVCAALTPVTASTTKKAKSVLRQAPPIDVYSVIDATPQPVRFWAPDAVRDGRRRNVPLLVYLHSWSTSHRGSDGMEKALAECRRRGWIFIAPDFRGPNRRPEACASPLAVQDVLDAVRETSRWVSVDLKRIYLLGGSGGGHMALMMASRAPELWAGVSAWVPITDLAAWHRFSRAKKAKYADDIEKCCGGPPGDPSTREEYRRRSPIFWLDQAKGLSIDINVGLRDGHEGSVPIDHSLKAFNVLARANGQPEKAIPEEDIAYLTKEGKIPKRLVQPYPAEPQRTYGTLLRATAGPARVTIFDGGHRIDPVGAIAWLSEQSREREAEFPPTQKVEGNVKLGRARSRCHGTTPAVSKHGMVASSQPLAVEVGFDILRKGGNAVDAAIAVNAMLGLTEPMSCGIGGDLFAIVWDAKSRRLYGLNASGRSPYAIDRELFKKLGKRSIPPDSPLSWSVPGCVDGWAELQKRFGSMGLDEILAPAIRHAKEGFVVTPVIARGWREAERFDDENARQTYAPGGHAPRAGETFRNPQLAKTYGLIARKGRDAFYRGAIARKIVALSKAKGGLFAMKDFQDHTSTWVDPVSTTYRGYEVWELPPNGQGIAVLEILNILAGYDLGTLGHNSVEHLHRFIEAKKLAFENRARFYADPDFADLPVRELISKEFGDKQRARIDLASAAKEIDPVDPRKIVRGDTVYLTVVDADRNAVSLIQSIYYGWGSKIAAADLGFMMQNRGCLFALKEDHLNRLEPHKRPFHTIIPAMVTKGGRPWMSFGVMGGDMQPQGQTQVLCNMLDFGMNVQEAGVVPRCRHNGSSTPTGFRMTRGGTVHLERGIPEAVAEGLREKGHRVSDRGTSYGGYQGIRIDWERGVLRGGSEPRKDGLALGY